MSWIIVNSRECGRLQSQHPQRSCIRGKNPLLRAPPRILKEKIQWTWWSMALAGDWVGGERLGGKEYYRLSANLNFKLNDLRFILVQITVPGPHWSLPSYRPVHPVTLWPDPPLPHPQPKRFHLIAGFWLEHPGRCQLYVRTWATPEWEALC